MELIKPENRDKLWEEIRQKTGLQILDIKIECMNLMDNCVTLSVSYAEENKLRVLKTSNEEPVNGVRDDSNSLSLPGNGSKKSDLLKKVGNYSFKLHNTWLLTVILISLILIFGVSMNGFAILV